MSEPVMFASHALRCPTFSAAEARALVADHYGFPPAALKPLASFQDQNFRVTDAAGRQFVLKIANAHETRATLDLQNQAMAHVAARAPDFPTPRVVPARDGAGLIPAEHAGERHWVRLLSYLPGQTLVDTPYLSPGWLDEIGATVGRLTAHLADFTHPAADRVLQWDLRQAKNVVTAFLPYVADRGRRALVERGLAEFEAAAEPRLAELRQSVIHGDLVDYNLLVGRGPAGQQVVSGLIDFGDTVRSYTIGELAVLLATIMAHAPAAPVAAAARVVAAYHAAFPLTETELAVLFPLIVLRVCATTTSAAQQAALEPENAYVQAFAAAEWPALELLAGLSPVLAQAAFRHACGLEPHPRRAAVEAWLRAHGSEFGRPLNRELPAGEVTVLDFSVSSEELPAGSWEQRGA
ncbi:MAG: phosphotransferase, partial [Anaerolineales bacterium]|nr:phosphotransferase [Anaerolineales bacterium]